VCTRPPAPNSRTVPAPGRIVLTAHTTHRLDSGYTSGIWTPALFIRYFSHDRRSFSRSSSLAMGRCSVMIRLVLGRRKTSCPTKTRTNSLDSNRPSHGTRLGSLTPQHNPASGSPDELPDVGVGDNHRLVVNLGGVLIERVGGLGAEIAVLEVEVKRADAVRAADAGELRASLDPLGSVVSHNLIVSPRREGTEHCGRVAKVMGADPSLPTNCSQLTDALS
jgi:hypothetical protein